MGQETLQKALGCTKVTESAKKNYTNTALHVKPEAAAAPEKVAAVTAPAEDARTERTVQRSKTVA